MKNNQKRVNTITINWKDGTSLVYEGTVHFTKDNSNVICITLSTDRSKIFIPISNIQSWEFISMEVDGELAE